jgi:SAM-dependent methyltransferase
MDGSPAPKSKKWRGNAYSETRFAVAEWLERELPSITGDVIIVSAGNWPVPKQLLTNPGIKSVKTFDRKIYGDSKNVVDFTGDVHSMPDEWNNKWDCVINNQSIECYEDPFKAMSEMYRILKPKGVLLIDAPFNYRWFGKGSWTDPKQNIKEVQDYWRITRNGWELLTKKAGFDPTKVRIERSGPDKHDPYCYMVKAIK